MIKLDYDRIPSKIKELKQLRDDLKIEVDKRCADVRKEVLDCAAELEVFYSYQRIAMEYFEQLEKLRLLEKTVIDAPDKLQPQLDSAKQSVQDLDEKMKIFAIEAFKVAKPYMDKAAQKIAEAYVECKKSGSTWEEKLEYKQATYLLPANTYMKVGYKLWKDSKSINNMKNEAFGIFMAISKCMKTIYNEKERHLVNYKAEHSKDLMSVEAAIAQLETLLEIKEQCKVLQYTKCLAEQETSN